jgi:serine/threonine protein kinase
MLYRLNHHNIIKAREMFIDEAHQRVSMVMDFFDGKDLSSMIAHYGGSIPEDIILNIFSSLLESIAYLHSKQVAHRDIHSGNVLVSKG